MAVKKKLVKKRKEVRKVDKGQVHIQSSFNNTLVTVTDMQGNTISWCSSGALGFKKVHSVCRSDGCGNRLQSR